MPSTGPGATIWITGLPAAGKSTTAQAAKALLDELGVRAAVLDGDALRALMDQPLGFSREDRATAVESAGRLALEHAASGTVALTALVSPYRDDRDKVRAAHEEAGVAFVEVWMATPVETCIERDPKHLYEKALRGELSHMTGIDDPFEPPDEPELAVTPSLTPDAAATKIIEALRRLGVL